MRSDIKLMGLGSEMDRNHLKRLVRNYIQEMLERDEGWRIERTRPLTTDELEGESYALSDLYDDTTDSLAVMNLEGAKPLVDALLKDQNITDVLPDSTDYKALAFKLLRANQVLSKIFLARSEGNYERAEDLQRRFLSQFQNDPLTNKEEPTDSKRFSEMVALIQEENELTGAKTVRSWKDYLGSNNLFIELMGDPYLSDINHKMINDFLDRLKRWPSHRSKRPAYRDLSTEQILALDVPPKDRIAVKTINKHLLWVSHTLAYACQRDFISKNYCEGIKLTSKTKMRADEEREAFTTEDLHKLFHSREYINDTFRSPFRFWLPVLGLFTGARLGELCQLEVDDVQKIDRVWCIVIRPGLDEDKESPASKEKKRIKVLSSRRAIPLHSFLLDDLRFLNYVQMMRDKGEKRLFPDVPYIHDAYSQYASKWFGDYRRRCGVDEPRKAYHSFRHTFSTNLKYQEVDYEIRGELEGHATGTAITGRYQKRFKADKLKRDGIDKLDFGIDLSHLRHSKYVIG